MVRSKSVEQVMEHVMERHYDFDLTYITERIISVFFLPDLEEQRYRRNLQEVASMLKSKHQDKFLVGHEFKNIRNINLVGICLLERLNNCFKTNIFDIFLYVSVFFSY